MTREEKLLEYFNHDELAVAVNGKYEKDGDITPDDMHRRMAKEFARIDEEFQAREMKSNDLSYYGLTRDPLNEDKIYKLFYAGCR